MLISLYTSRVVLNALGVEDFGIYNVVGGVVAMFSIMSGALSTATTRFITFELGKKNFDKLKKVFSTSINIQVLISVCIVIVAETAGLWFLNAKMNIPDERMTAANWVFQFSVLTFVVTLISIPYNAAIIAHEQMKIFAYIGILEVILKLAIVYLLLLSSFDKLIVYAFLLLLVSIAIRMIYGIYCKRHFPECKYYFVLDKPLLKEMTRFAGWNFIGSSAYVLKEQGVNIVLNLFCGVAINAARGIAAQVNHAITGFVNNFIMALNPQITKSYAENNRNDMLMLVQQGARFSFYLLLLLALPVIIDTEYVLTVWLRLVPEHAVNFVRLILIYAMGSSLSNTLVTAMLATGRIKKYQIIVGGLNMMNLPVSYLCLRLGAAPESTMLVAIVISQICLAARLWLLRNMIGLSSKYYLKHIYAKVLIVFLLSCVAPVLVYFNMPQGFLRLVLITLVSLLSCSAIILFVGCSANERKWVYAKVETAKNKFYKR
jgi:O-antigen/teichoic acid export membrane protein